MLGWSTCLAVKIVLSRTILLNYEEDSVARGCLVISSSNHIDLSYRWMYGP